MSTMLDAGAGLIFWYLAMIVMWIVPLVLAIWFMRMVSAMVKAQRAIAEQLQIIAQQGRQNADARS